MRYDNFYCTLLFVQDRNMPLKEPTHANVLVPVYGNDVPLIGCEGECSKKGRL